MKSNSIYAINKKNPKAIVYIDAMGNETRLTKEDFSCAEEFSYWKKWLDESFHEEEKSQHIYEDHTVSLEALSDEALCVSGIDELLIEKEDEDEIIAIRTQCLMEIQKGLTPKQFQRSMMYYGEQMTETEIASAEKVSQQKISRSISTGINRARIIGKNRCE